MPDRTNHWADRWRSLNIGLSKFYSFFSQERYDTTVDAAPAPSLSTNCIMDGYVFNFTNVAFNPPGDPPCPTPPAFSSYDYRNPSHQPFPPGSAQPVPQPLTPPDSSYGHPALDPVLLSISNPPLVPSSLASGLVRSSPAVQVTASLHDITPTSRATVECQPNISSSDVPTAPGVATPSSHPNGPLSDCNGATSVTTVTGNKSTWATRNPGWPVMQPRQPLSATEKERRTAQTASRQISAAQRKDRDALLNEAVQLLSSEFEAKVEVIAATHNITDEKVRKLLGGYKYYRNPRSTQLANAIIHDKAHEVNEGKFYCSLAGLYSHMAGRARGEKLSLQQIRGLARDDPKYQDMTQDEKDELLRALTEYRTLKNTSVRAMNAAASRDVQSTLEYVFKVVSLSYVHSADLQLTSDSSMDSPFGPEYMCVSSQLVGMFTTRPSLSGMEQTM